MSEKKSFLMYKSWDPIIETLDELSAGILLKAVYAHQLGKDYEITDPSLRSIFALFVAEFDKNDAAWEEECRKRSAAAKEREANKKAQQTTAVQNCAQEPQLCTVSTDKEKDKDKEEDKDGLYNSSHSNVFIPPTEEEIEDYARAHQYKHVNAKEFVSHYASKGWRVGAWPMSDWKASVDGWEIRKARETEARARSGTTKQKNKFNAFEQRDYDYAALEDKLMKKVTAE